MSALLMLRSTSRPLEKAGPHPFLSTRASRQALPHNAFSRPSRLSVSASRLASSSSQADRAFTRSPPGSRPVPFPHMLRFLLYALISSRFAAVTVTFSSTMAPSVPSSLMALHWHPE